MVYTALQIPAHKNVQSRKPTPSTLACVLVQRKCRELVKEFGRPFIKVTGKPQEIDSHRSRSGGRRYKAKHKARELMAA